MTTISAQTILRSRNLSKPDCVLSTLLLRYPRFIHAEVMTHRVFSRNAGSSRAIPVAKMINDIQADPAMPIFWGKNQKGMQAFEENDALVRDHDGLLNFREGAWRSAMFSAMTMAEHFAEAGYHKQVVNRLLEPFMHITVLVSSTEWSNFLELRDHPDAEPHIQMLAREIRKCLEEESTVQDLEPGEWHLPFISRGEFADADQYGLGIYDLRMLSVARCASTSYRTVDGFDMTLERAREIFDKLVTSKPIHASPLEHVAQADHYGLGGSGGWSNRDQHGNFVGFRQYRHMLEAA